MLGTYCREGEASDGGVFISENGWQYWEKYYGNRNAAAEFSLMSFYLSSALLPHKRCVIHAVAFSINGHAWLISAPPGTGKSTQLKTLKELYPGEITTICGDRPILELTDDGKVLVHPSPWNGKEGWGGSEIAPLAGIIILNRGKKNDLWHLPTDRAAVYIYTALLKNAEDEEDITRAASFADKLLRRTNVWFMENKGVPDSTKMLYDELLSREKPL